METSRFNLDPADTDGEIPQALHGGPDIVPAEAADDGRDVSQDPFQHPRVLACATFWAGRCAARGITDLTMEDLLHEAWRRTTHRLPSIHPDKHAAYLRRTIKNIALMRLTRGREAPDERFESRIAELAAQERPSDETEHRLQLEATLRFLDRNRAVILGQVAGIFGALRRADGLWAASRQAVEHLMIQDMRLGIDEILTMCLQNAHAFWRADGKPGEPLRTVIERRRKRSARDTPALSFITLYVALRWAYSHNPRVCRALASRHIRHLSIAIRECRNSARLAMLRAHRAEVRRAIGESPEDPQP